MLHVLEWTLLGTGCPVVCRKHRGCTKPSHNTVIPKDVPLRGPRKCFWEGGLCPLSCAVRTYLTGNRVWHLSRALEVVSSQTHQDDPTKRPVPQTPISPPRFYGWHFATFTLLLRHLCAHLFIHPSNLSTNPPLVWTYLSVNYKPVHGPSIEHAIINQGSIAE